MIKRLATSAWLVPAVLAILFLPSLVGRQRLAFRDVSFFYTPLYQHVASLGGLANPFPYWNPSDGWTDGVAGMPLAGETTTAVFYPVRMVVYGVIKDPMMAMAWYTFLHLSVAAAAMFWLAKHVLIGIEDAPRRKTQRLTWRKTQRKTQRQLMRCNLAAITYALSGPIVSLYCNTVFLVSAAWLPLAMVMPAVWYSGRICRPRHWMISGIAAGLMTLGGDPQTTLHVAMVWLVSAVGIAIFRRGVLMGNLVSLVMASGIMIATAMPQIAESAAWAWQANRGGSITNQQRMQFSVSPWHWVESLTPWAWGRLVPIHARLSRLIENDGALWASTLFMGTFGMMSMLSALVTPTTRRRCLPWFIVGSSAAVLSMGDQFFWPVYRWLSDWFPFYQSFRYPPKWLPMVSLSIAAVVASVSVRRVFAKTKCWPIVLSAALVIHLGYCFWLAGHPVDVSDDFWGPLRRGVALRMIGVSIAVTLTTACSFWWLGNRFRRTGYSPNAMIGLLAAVELVLVARLIVHQVPRERSTLQWNRPSERFVRISHPDSIPGRWSGQWPDRWRQTDAPDRLIEVERTLWRIGFGRWHLAHNTMMINSMFSIEPGSLRGEFERLRERQALSPDDQALREFVLDHHCDGVWWEIHPESKNDDVISPRIVRYDDRRRADVATDFARPRPTWISGVILWWVTIWIGAAVVLVFRKAKRFNFSLERRFSRGK